MSSHSADVLSHKAELPTVLKALMLMHTTEVCVCRYSKSPSKVQILWRASRNCCGNFDGKSIDASFSQPMGVCVEMDKNIFVTDAQVGSVKLITSIKGTIGFLKHIGLLNKAVSVNIKHQPTAKLSLTRSDQTRESLYSYLQEANKCVLDQLDKPCKPAGQHGTISHQTESSVSMILRGLKDLYKFLDNVNPAYIVIFTRAWSSKWRALMQWATLRTNNRPH